MTIYKIKKIQHLIETNLDKISLVLLILEQSFQPLLFFATLSNDNRIQNRRIILYRFTQREYVMASVGK